MKLNEMSVSLKDYLAIIGAEVETKQQNFKGEWEATLGAKLETGRISGWFKLKDVSRETAKYWVEGKGKSPEEAIKNICKLFHEGLCIYKDGHKFTFPFKKLIIDE